MTEIIALTSVHTEC